MLVSDMPSVTIASEFRLFASELSELLCWHSSFLVVHCVAIHSLLWFDNACCSSRRISCVGSSTEGFHRTWSRFLDSFDCHHVHDKVYGTQISILISLILLIFRLQRFRDCHRSVWDLGFRPLCTRHLSLSEQTL